MVDFKKLMEQPPMTEEERKKLWQDWYDNLPPGEKKNVDKMRERP